MTNLKIALLVSDSNAKCINLQYNLASRDFNLVRLICSTIFLLHGFCTDLEKIHLDCSKLNSSLIPYLVITKYGCKSSSKIKIMQINSTDLFFFKYLLLLLLLNDKQERWFDNTDFSKRMKSAAGSLNHYRFEFKAEKCDLEIHGTCLYQIVLGPLVLRIIIGQF